MAFGINIVTDNVAALTTKLDAHGLRYVIWNPEACSSTQKVEAQLGFESRADQMAARDILGVIEA